jgi:AraC-like DNA-binding protein
MHLLSARTVPLDALLDGDADRLVGRLVAEPGWAARFALLERAVAGRLAEAVGPTPGVVWAWSRLTETDGRVPISALVDELGWSAKRLVSRFKEEIGLSPKSVARLLRFERASTLLAQEAPPTLAAVAFDCGYYDQSHQTNELRRITGVTPTAYAESFGRAHFFQDVLAAPS